MPLGPSVFNVQLRSLAFEASTLAPRLVLKTLQATNIIDFLSSHTQACIPDKAAMDPNISAEDEAIRKLLGTSSFGKQDAAANVQAQIALSKRKEHVGSSKAIEHRHSAKPRTQHRADVKIVTAEDGAHGHDSDEDDDDDDDDDDDSDEDEFPISHEIVLKTHERPVTSVTLDASGTRLVSGSTDCTFKLHDFPSMTPTTLKAFRSVDPSESKISATTETHSVHQVSFNPLAPSQVLVITALPQAKIFDRDGELLTEFVKGDMYLRDLNNTKGHISEITSGAWCPTDRNLCVTAGTDSTLRIWDAKNRRSQREVIVFKSKAAGAAGRTRMTAVAWAPQESGTSSVVVSAGFDGSLVAYNGNGPYTRPLAEVRDAHVANTWTSGLAISSDGRLLVSRGGDDTVKLWDLRKFKQPVSTGSYPSTSSQYPTSNVIFSPNSSNVLLGSPSGHLHILNPATLRAEVSTPVTPGSPLITVLWHDKLNQIVTGSANGETHVLYNPNTSVGGALLVLSKAPKRRYIDDDPNRTVDLAEGYSGDSIVIPGSGQSGSNLSSAARHPALGSTGKGRDPRRPHLPATTPFSRSEPSEKHIMDSVPLSSMRDEDPREALLKYAEKAKNDPLFTKAWEKTQPETLYAKIEEDEEPDKKKVKR
jgi:WD40 repeat protein